MDKIESPFAAIDKPPLTEMSSTIRVFQNNNRVATATFLKDGNVLQVYPTKKTFPTEAAFREHWRDLTLKTLEFKEADRPAKKAATAEPPKVSTEGWSVNEKQREFTAPAGTYYIGDLCYALPRDLYDKVFGDVGGYSSGLYSKGDDFFMLDGTAYGDGEYPGSDGNKFAVDAGIIGIAPIRICDMRGGTRINGGHIYTFKKPVKCRFGGGVFNFYEDGFRTLRIDTAAFEDEDECWDDDECDCCACKPR